MVMNFSSNTNTPGFQSEDEEMPVDPGMDGGEVDPNGDAPVHGGPVNDPVEEPDSGGVEDGELGIPEDGEPPPPPDPGPEPPPDTLPVSLPGSVGGSFVDPGSMSALPYQSVDFMTNRFQGMGQGQEGGIRRGPGAGISGQGLGLLQDGDMDQLRQILGRGRKGGGF